LNCNFGLFNQSGSLLIFVTDYYKTIGLIDINSLHHHKINNAEYYDLNIEDGVRVTCTCFNPNEKYIAIGTYDGTILIYRIIISRNKSCNLKLVNSIILKDIIWNMCYSPCGSYLAIGADKETYVYF